jgi:beta-lactam-binding protein with PASTA domain
MRRLGAALLLICVFVGCSRDDRVTVPRVQDKCVVKAYEQLHDLELRVEIEGRFAVASTYCPGVAGQAPKAGTKVDAGSVVKLDPGFGLHGLLVVTEPDRVVVPDVIGARLDAATRRLESLGLAWMTRRLPPLPASDAPTLLAAYKVTKMEPGPGETHDQHRVRRNMTTTKPLTLWATPAR